MVERRWRPLILASTRAILDSVVNSAKSISAAEDDGVLRPRRSRFANEDGGSASASLRLKAGISCGACPQRRVRTTPSTHARTSSTTATPIPPPPSPTSSAAPTPTPPGFSTSTRSTNKLWRSSRRYMGAEQWRWGRASYTHGDSAIMGIVDIDNDKANPQMCSLYASEIYTNLCATEDIGGGSAETFSDILDMQEQSRRSTDEDSGALEQEVTEK
ncbi:uncharacterized protein LOC109719145 isoform X1 [Ananas comosus]|uniref:Uncharacterized protein LOC109709925 isoform X1 n=1 Tax=Ananas comosus TaxID=4615 RepID=A0A6P5FY23_ANACO|nr:uncharacterized protein LOC109709925 isoform X1 [Ananas comosus]XP_020101266.1 uncharacterized protein LOC109719145 isoform X1 [Ananas comosus]